MVDELLTGGGNSMQNNTSGLIFTNADTLISYLTKLAVSKNNVFRGYGRQSELFPSIIREKDWSTKEINLLNEFEKYGLQYFSANNPVDFMSYAQHYGLPTRLLDFTYNPFTALFFALFMPKSTNYTYEADKQFYYIRYCNLNDQIHIRTLPFFGDNYLQSSSFTAQCSNMIFLLARILRGLEEEVDEHEVGTKAIINYFKKIYCESNPGKGEFDIPGFQQFIPEFNEFLKDEIFKFQSKKILFIDANQCSQRIVMQQGLFMFPYTLNQTDHLDIIKSNTSEIKIHKSIRDDLLDYLDTIGINAFRLMPDLQNVCNSVKRKITEERQFESSLFMKKMNLSTIELDKLHDMLRNAYDRYKRPDGFANISPVGAFLKRSMPDFNTREFGFSKLFDLIANYPEKYEVKKEKEDGSVPVAAYKCI